MSEDAASAPAAREPVLDPVDRVSELIFGLLMALSFTGAVSVAESGRAEIRTMFIAALGCNLAWGLVDAVMFVVRSVAARGKSISLLNAVRSVGPDPKAGQAIIGESLGRVAATLVTGTGEVLTVDAISINLADGHYLRLGMGLQLTRETKTAPNPSRALDLAIAEFSGHTVAEVSDPATRDKMKAELLTSLEKAYKGEVMDLYLTNFVTQ